MTTTANTNEHGLCVVAATALILCASLTTGTRAAPVEPVQTLVAKEKAPLLATLKDLVSIESFSGDRAGLDKIAALIGERLAALGGKVEMIEPDPADVYHMVDTPKEIGKMVLARFTGTGTKKILLIAHMDTVYMRGMLAKQPFRIDGNRAYGLRHRRRQVRRRRHHAHTGCAQGDELPRLRPDHGADQRRRGGRFCRLARHAYQTGR